MLDLTKLNKQQQKAVETINGPVSVLAGAGTGKTRTLTYRIAYMIYSGINPSEIVAVTFTNKAAFEMKKRVIELVGPYAEELSVSTFHSFCARFLRNEAEKLDERYTSRFLIIDEEDSKQIIRDTVGELEYDTNKYNSIRLKNLFSMYKNNQIDFLEGAELIIYNAYNKYLKDNNSMDFDDLVNNTVELLKKNEKVRSYYQDRYKYILVDEFQDTNLAQYELVKLLSGKNNNIFTVGDPDQSIYSFRGANYANQQRFIKEYNPKVIFLEENYRSTTNILAAANKLIENNQSRVGEKELTSSLGEGSEVMFVTRSSDRDEAYFVAEAIKIMVAGGYDYSDIAVLYRSNSISRIFEEAFLKAGIPYVIYGGLSFFARKEIKDILAYIRVVLNPHDTISLKRIINVPRRRIGNTTVSKIESYAKLNNISMYEAISEGDFGAATNKRLRSFQTIIEALKEEIGKVNNLTDIIDIVNNISGYREMLENEGEESKDRLENIQELKAIFYNARLENEKATNIEVLEELLIDLSLMTNLDKDDTVNTVKVATVHQVKGLEFKTVFLVAMEETIFPAQASMMSTFDLEEERRVCYVGVTRAKERLIISNAIERFRFGMVKRLEPSRYINELKIDAQPIKIKKVEAPKKEEIGELKIGDKVSHDFFGNGVVVQEDEEIIKVAFTHPVGIKIIKKNHPALKKIEK